MFSAHPPTFSQQQSSPRYSEEICRIAGVKAMLISYKFRIYPSKAKLNEQLEICCWLYNKLLEEVNEARRAGKKTTWKDTQALIVQLKQEKPELNLFQGFADGELYALVEYQSSERAKEERKEGWMA